MVSPVQRRGQKAVMTFATGWSRAFEIAGTTAVFTLLGLWLDSKFGTRPVLTIIFFVFAVAGLAVRSYYTYNAAMDEQEKGKPWTRSLK